MADAFDPFGFDEDDDNNEVDVGGDESLLNKSSDFEFGASTTKQNTSIDPSLWSGWGTSDFATSSDFDNVWDNANDYSSNNTGNDYDTKSETITSDRINDIGNNNTTATGGNHRFTNGMANDKEEAIAATDNYYTRRREGGRGRRDEMQEEKQEEGDVYVPRGSANRERAPSDVGESQSDIFSSLQEEDDDNHHYHQQQQQLSSDRYSSSFELEETEQKQKQQRVQQQTALPNDEVDITVQEQLNCLYDENANATTSRVQGIVHVKECRQQLRQDSSDGNGGGNNSKPFCIVIRDVENQLDRIQEGDSSICHDITNIVPLEPLSAITECDRVFRVTVPAIDSITTGTSTKNKTTVTGIEKPIITYICDHTLRPVPLLVKTKAKVMIKKPYCRVGIKIRSNPTNVSSLTKLSLLVAIPPDILGETVKMSQAGGVWDSMKRVVSWTLNDLQPGESIDIQCQFEFISHDNYLKAIASQKEQPAKGANGDITAATNNKQPKFPVLVRCDVVDHLLSKIEINTNHTDDLCPPPSIKMNLQKSVRILHRKV